MYSDGSVAVDKGLGFDFSDITNIVKEAVPVGLKIFNNQMQKKQIQQQQRSNMYNGYVPQSPGVYGQAYGQLPLSQYLQPQQTFGEQYPQQSSGIDTGTILAIGAAAVVGLLAYKMLR